MDKISRMNPLLEILKSSPRRINKIFIQKSAGPRRIGTVIAEARKNEIPYLFVPKQKLDRMASHHQGLVAEISPKEFVALEDILSGTENPLLILLDEIEDPQNLGAIIRSAAGSGTDGLVLPERRSAGLTETVATVSAGALEHLQIARVVNLARSMDVLRERGIWIVGAESGGQGLWFEFDYTLPVALVLGSEGKGLRPLVRKKCDRILSIPLSGRVTSLNVAAAAAVFLFEVVRQRTSGVRPDNR